MAGNRGRAGDWRSVRLDPYSHDRNVASVVESESRNIAAPGTNATVNGAQFLGTLAPNEKSGDDNRRLGFEVYGALTARNDVDMYSFTASAGTEVWLDIDRTGAELDTVIELIDSSGRVLARSNDSTAEADDPSLLFRSSLMAAGTVNPLRKAGYDRQQPTAQSALAVPDYYTTNPRDAGMRLVLPGQPGASATYHVRVRSAGDNHRERDGGQDAGPLSTAGASAGTRRSSRFGRQLCGYSLCHQRHRDPRAAGTFPVAGRSQRNGSLRRRAGEFQQFDRHGAGYRQSCCKPIAAH